MRVLFYRSGKKENSEGLAPIVCRVTIQGQRSEISTGIYLSQKAYNYAKFSGCTTEQLHLMKAFEQKAYAAYNKLLNNGRMVCSADIVLALRSKESNTKRIYFSEYIEEYFLQRATDKAHNTKRGYNSKLNIINTWLVHSGYDKLRVDEFKIYHWNEFKTFLHNLGDGSEHLRRFLLHFRSLFNQLSHDDIIGKNPLLTVRIDKAKPKEIKHLTSDQLHKLKSLSLTPGMELVRDRFMVQCYTGLSYCDLQSFVPSQRIKFEPIVHVDGKRGKNGHSYIVPLRDEVLQILLLYPDGFRRISNQKYNTQLKKLGEMANVPFPLTTHVGRKTFAMSMLNQGMSIESVSKMLGHSSIAITQSHYAQVKIDRILSEFNLIFKAA